MIQLNTPTPYASDSQKYAIIKTVITLCVIILFTTPLLYVGSMIFLYAVLAEIVLFGLPNVVSTLLRYRYVSFTVEEEKITVTYGVVTKQSRAVPYDKVQSVSCISGPLMRMFGISTISIWTASPSQVVYNPQIRRSVGRPDVILVLQTADAEWLKEFISNKSST